MGENCHGSQIWLKTVCEKMGPEKWVLKIENSDNQGLTVPLIVILAFQMLRGSSYVWDVTNWVQKLLWIFADFIDISQIDAGDNSEDDSFSEEETVTILSFFNDCSLQELASVPGLSSKKAEKIIKMRPFDSWRDLVRKQLLPPICQYILGKIFISKKIIDLLMYVI